jgi:hypothetical protein
MIRLLTGLASVLLMIQCQQSKPEAPKAEGFDPPIPPTLSYVAGPITFPLQVLKDKINQALDPVLIGKETPDGKVKGIMSFRVKRMGPVRVQYIDQQVLLSAPLQMWLTKPFSKDTTPPDKPFCAMEVKFKTPIRITMDWRIASHTTFSDYTWLRKPEMHLLGANISLTTMVQKVLDKHKTDIEQAIDSAVYEKLRLDQMVEPTWRDLQKPMLISKEYGLWLIPNPVSVAAGKVGGNKEQLTVPLRIAFETSTKLKPETPEYTKTPLPSLQKREQVPLTSDLHLMNFIPYADINRMLAITVNKQDKKLVMGGLTLKSASVYGGQHALIVKAGVKGLFNGTVYLKGRPVFDTLTNTLKVDKLDFDGETGSVLSKKAGTLWHDSLRKLLEGLITIHLGDDIADLPKKINEAFEKGPGKKTDMGIGTFRFVPQKIAIRPDGIQVLIHVKSTIALRVDKL